MKATTDCAELTAEDLATFKRYRLTRKEVEAQRAAKPILVLRKPRAPGLLQIMLGSQWSAFLSGLEKMETR